ncbi:hypothetical protein DFH06DRAFT_214894 [Mycena polygramma]|nr:hypothetical protein DFH06DRAFT_214894 [Mycena polygramma]
MGLFWSQLSDLKFPQLPERRLPSELERTIFEIAALSCTTDIPNLVLVAARVKEWVEPLLYHIVIIRSHSVVHLFPMGGFPVLCPEIMHEPRKLLKKSARHLFLSTTSRSNDDVDAFAVILRACDNITNLFLHYTRDSCWDALRIQKQVRRLTIGVMDRSRLNITDPLLQNLTHLEVLDRSWLYHRIDIVSACATLLTLSNLTHFAMDLFRMCDSRMAALVGSNARLQCILALHEDFWYNPEDVQLGPLASDVRFVLRSPAYGLSHKLASGGQKR